MAGHSLNYPSMNTFNGAAPLVRGLRYCRDTLTQNAVRDRSGILEQFR
jgi:hypothetical protein